MGVGAPFVLSLLLFFSSSPPLFPPAPQASYFVDEQKTGSASCGILPWACFGDAVSSFVGYYAAAQEAEFKFVPKTFPLCKKTQHRPIDNLIDRFFCMYRGTVHLQQKKRYNQIIKPLRTLWFD